MVKRGNKEGFNSGVIGLIIGAVIVSVVFVIYISFQKVTPFEETCTTGILDSACDNNTIIEVENVQADLRRAYEEGIDLQYNEKYCINKFEIQKGYSPKFCYIQSIDTIGLSNTIEIIRCKCGS